MRLIIPAILAALCLAPACAHDAGGWRYPLECCSDRDCSPVAPENVETTPQGFIVHVGEETFTISRNRSRISPDGRYHECHMPGARELLCFFYPPMGS